MESLSPAANGAATALKTPPAESAGDASRALRLLVGYDGRPASRDALAFAKAICETTGAELTVASVRGYWPELLGDSFELVVKEDERWISRGATEVLRAIPFSVKVLAGGHESEGLRELAEAEESDMIVVGSTHRGRIGRVCPGSVGERVLGGAPCTVAVAPRGLAEKQVRFGKIAVGYDGSEQARVALTTAIDLAERTGASLLIIGVVEKEEALRLEGEPLNKQEEARLERRLEQAVERARSTVDATSQIVHGAPSHVIPEAAEDADLLIIGSRGHFGAARKLLLGSVAARVMRVAPCPTLITPTA
jgi:nucleotide-binding universal stress UspA family protein